MKILLVCYGGLSTSILVNNMKRVINESEKFKDRGIIIEAWGKEDYVLHLNDCDCLLLGPQVSMIKDDVEKYVLSNGYHFPVLVINKDDYGMMAAVPILAEAFKAIKNSKQG